MTTIKLRRGTAAEWTAANPILADGEAGFERDTGKLKIGNGTQNWSALPYFSSSDSLTISSISGLQAALDGKEAVGAVAAHVAAADQHPEYLTPAEADSRYPIQYGEHVVTWNGTGWRYRGQTITVRPTIPAFPDAYVLWKTANYPSYTAPPPLAVVGDDWMPHGSVVL
jgi:hypothetical protein